MEFPHVLRLLEERQFDTIYHEHYSYSLADRRADRRSPATASRSRTSRRSRHTAGRCASMLRHADASRRVHPSVAELLDRERERGPARTSETYARLGSDAEAVRRRTARVPRGGSTRGTHGSSATARRPRATRSSTTAASRRDLLRTRSTARRTSRAASCRARTCRSTLPSGCSRTGPTTCSSCRGTSRTRSSSR